MRYLSIAAAALAGVLTLTSVSGSASAADAVHPPAEQWGFTGPFGTYDRKAARRGLQVYQDVCAACHSLNLLSFRHLSGLGFSEDEIKALAAKSEVIAEPNEDGEVIDDGDFIRRPGRPADRFVAPYLNDQAAAAANGGAIPPDLSVMTKAREGHQDYLFALLAKGYREEAPEGITPIDGKSYNIYFPGVAIGMSPPLSEDVVEYADGTKASVEQMARDVTEFLAWAAEPEAEDRKRMGFKVLIFLIVFTAMLYAIKRRVWAKLH